MDSANSPLVPDRIILIRNGELTVVLREDQVQPLLEQGWRRVEYADLTPEQQLELETGHDVEQTGDDPPTYVETDLPAPDSEEE